MKRGELVALPKVELHCHLDGSLSREFIEKRLGRKVSQAELSVSEDFGRLDMMCSAVCIRNMYVMRKSVLLRFCPRLRTWTAGK